MPDQPRKLSEIMKEMSETLLRNPSGVPSSEAAHVALFFANVAWNESVGLDHAREGYPPLSAKPSPIGLLESWPQRSEGFIAEGSSSGWRG